MFAKTIIDSDAFLDMPLSTQALYFHLSMRADDDGFVNNPKKIARMIGATEDDYKLLIAKSFVLLFESGVIVIKHWRINNYIRGDRKHDTVYTEEYDLLSIKENGAYTLENTTVQPNDSQLVGSRYTEYRLGKDSIGKVNNNIGRFTPPTLDDVNAYCQERNNHIDPQTFIDFYSSKGWMIGKNKMKDWKAAIRTWERHDNKATEKKPQYKQFSHSDNYSDLDELLAN